MFKMNKQPKLLLLAGILLLLAHISLSLPAFAQEEGGSVIYLPTVMTGGEKPDGGIDDYPSESDFDLVFRVANSGNDLADCGSEAQPCASIQQAVNRALANQDSTVLIKIAGGTYTSTGKTVVNLEVDLFANATPITMVGGYTTSDWSGTSLDPSHTIIDGQNARRGMYVRNFAQMLTLEALTIQNGLLADALLYDNLDAYAGGGLYCLNSPMRLKGITIKNNKIQRTGVGAEPVSGGGAAFYRDCPVTMEDVIFDGNLAQAANASDNTRGGQALGGGFHATTGSHVTATNLTLTNNKAIGGSGGIGIDTQGNRPDGLGGGAALQVNDVVINGLTATGNEAIAGTGTTYGGYGDGGGLFFEVSTGDVRNGILSDNLATSSGLLTPQTGGTSGGGAIMGTESSLTLDRLTMVNNTARGGNGSFSGHALGGALYVDKLGQHPMIVTASNLIIADNTCEAGEGQNRWGGGGAIHSAQSEFTLEHSTLANNKVLDTMLGPAIEIVSSPSTGSRMTIDNTIVANHTDTPLQAVIVALDGSQATLDHTLFFNNSGGDTGAPFGNGDIRSTNEISGDPDFVNPDSPTFNYHIGANSAARDQGTGSAISHDIDNQARDGSPDIGADEYVP